ASGRILSSVANSHSLATLYVTVPRWNGGSLRDRSEPVTAAAPAPAPPAATIAPSPIEGPRRVVLNADTSRLSAREPPTPWASPAAPPAPRGRRAPRHRLACRRPASTAARRPAA